MIGIVFAVCFGMIFVELLSMVKKRFINKIEDGVKKHLNSLYKFKFTEERFLISKWAYIYVGIVGFSFTLVFGYLFCIFNNPALVAQDQVVLQIVFGMLGFLSLVITLLFLLFAFPRAYVDVTKKSYSIIMG